MILSYSLNIIYIVQQTSKTNADLLFIWSQDFIFLNHSTLQYMCTCMNLFDCAVFCQQVYLGTYNECQLPRGASVFVYYEENKLQAMISHHKLIISRPSIYRMTYYIRQHCALHLLLPVEGDGNVLTSCRGAFFTTSHVHSMKQHHTRPSVEQICHIVAPY